VSDAVWQELQPDNRAADRRVEDQGKLTQLEKELKDRIEKEEVRAEQETQLLQEPVVASDDNDSEMGRLHEEARLRHEIARRARAAELADLERKKKEAEEERRKEAQAQKNP